MARAPGAGDDEYQELQKRFATLENERKNLFEHTQVLAEPSVHVHACLGSGVGIGDLPSCRKRTISVERELISALSLCMRAWGLACR
jgi:hypothetical protein